MPNFPTPLLFDSISKNTGDIAIGIAARQLLEKRGVTTSVPSPFEADLVGPAVIGGGELIRLSGDEFYDAFRREGPHILNASGIWTSADHLSYLNDYAFVSARSSREVEVLQQSVPDARLLPCATTLLESPRFDLAGTASGEPLVGIHLAPHALRLIEDIVEIVDRIPYRKVFIPFTHYNRDRSFMASLPFNMSNAVLLDDLQPLELHSIIGQLKYLIATSLHASIFAFSQNVPFASIYQKKVGYYFSDRGLGEHVVDNGDALRTIIQRFDTEPADFSALIAADRDAVNTAFDSYADIIHSAKPAPATFQYPQSVQTQSDNKVISEQTKHVIHDRDLAIAMAEARRRLYVGELAAERTSRMQAEETLARTEAALQRANSELQAINAQLQHIRSRWYVRALLATRRYLLRLFKK